MSIVIDLPKELEECLSAGASRMNLSISEYAVRILEEALICAPVNGQELVEYWRRRGLIGTLQSDESTADISRRLRREVERRVTPVKGFPMNESAES